jgi:hypothetical protein
MSDGFGLQRLTPEIWRWTAPHPEWRTRSAWSHEVASFALLVGETLVLVDPLAPPDAERLWSALDELIAKTGASRLSVMTTIHYHVRSSGEIYRRYAGRLEVAVHGHPTVAERLGPEVPLETIEPGAELPAGARAFAIGKPRRREMPLHFPSVQALAFGDAIVGVDSELRVWEKPERARTAWYRDRLLPTLEPLRELEPEHVLVTHGPPAIGDGATKLARALTDPPWWGHRER